MKKLVDVCIGNWSEAALARDGKRVLGEDFMNIIEKECNPYITKSDGVIIYLTNEEYRQLSGDERYNKK